MVLRRRTKPHGKARVSYYIFCILLCAIMIPVNKYYHLSFRSYILVRAAHNEVMLASLGFSDSGSIG